MRRSRAPSQQFPLVPKEDIEKGVTVVRSPLEVLALIKSCSDTTNENVFEEVQPGCNRIKNNCETSRLKLPQIAPTKILKDIGSKRKFTTNVRVSPWVSESKSEQENTNSNEQLVSTQTDSLGSKKYNVTWGKQTTKKHKTWENDGYLIVTDKLATLQDTNGHKLGSTSDVNSLNLEDGSIIVVGSKQVQILDLVKESDTTESAKSTVNACHLLPRKRPKTMLMIDVDSPDVFVLPEPNIDHQYYFNKQNEKITPVVLESFLAKHLRPHQKTGVTFLYECVSGFKAHEYFGAILADEMGLGKTFQTICLIWILLKRGPYGGTPVAKRILIVAPSSLVGNWENEFIRWLGRDKLRLFCVDQKKKPSEFTRLPARNYPVMITSYEMLVRYSQEIEKINFDLMICDEGHRLKNNTTNTSIALNQIKCKRRVLLSGTPIQNELAEFFALIDFVNPGILGTYLMFKREFEDKIVESQQPECHPQIMVLGKQKAAELNEITEKFILRRTQDVNNKYLPSKHESVVFCAMASLQIRLYEESVSYWENRVQEFGLSTISHFGVISMLKKICNHPELVLKKNNSDTDTTEETLSTHLNRTFSLKPSLIESSGKLVVVDNILKELHKNGSEKTVLISYYTQTLDIFVQLCNIKQYKYLRLDGTTATSQRTDIVKKFNTANSGYSILLLSAKAGGVGLNLIGASNLILYDSDWNPASDQQAMARIWRDGQKKSVYIYRLLTSGTIEEKIFQRQISKTGLSEAITNPDAQNNTKLSFNELKDLFNFKKDALCVTHDLLECDCGGNGLVLNNSANEYDGEKSETPLRVSELMKWEHHSSPFNNNVLEAMNLSGVSKNIHFLFRNKTNSL